MAGAQQAEYDLEDILEWHDQSSEFPERMYGGAVVYLDRMGNALCVRCAEGVKGSPMEAQGARIAGFTEQVRCLCGRAIN